MVRFENCSGHIVELFIGYNFYFLNKIDRNHQFRHISEFISVCASVFKMDGYTSYMQQPLVYYFIRLFMLQLDAYAQYLLFSATFSSSTTFYYRSLQCHVPPEMAVVYLHKN